MSFVPRLYDYAASGNCLKVRAALRLLGREFERVPIDIFAGETLTAEFAAVNTMRTTPVLEAAPGRFLPESGAILLHVAEGTELLPADPLDRADVYRWLFFERAFTPAVGGVRFFKLTGREEIDPGFVAEGLRTGGRLLRKLDRHLGSRQFLAAEALTVADLSLYAYAHVAPDAGFDLASYPAVAAWVARVEAVPGFVNDLAPYPESSRPGRSRSIYDA